MRALLEFAMRSRLAAVGVVALGALMPLLFWLSAGLLALITLRRGLAEGGLILAGATAALVPIYAVMLGTPLAVLQPLALIWLPVMGMAQVLRVRVSLATAIQAGALVAAGAVVAFYGLYGDPSVFWRQVLEVLSQQLLAAPPGEGWPGRHGRHAKPQGRPLHRIYATAENGAYCNPANPPTQHNQVPSSCGGYKHPQIFPSVSTPLNVACLSPSDTSLLIGDIGHSQIGHLTW